MWIAGIHASQMWTAGSEEKQQMETFVTGVQIRVVSVNRVTNEEICVN